MDWSPGDLFEPQRLGSTPRPWGRAALRRVRLRTTRCVSGSHAAHGSPLAQSRPHGLRCRPSRQLSASLPPKMRSGLCHAPTRKQALSAAAGPSELRPRPPAPWLPPFLRSPRVRKRSSEVGGRAPWLCHGGKVSTAAAVSDMENRKPTLMSGGVLLRKYQAEYSNPWFS